MKKIIAFLIVPGVILAWDLNLSWNKTLDAHTFSAPGIYDITGDSLPELLVPGNRILYCLNSVTGDTIWTFAPESNYFPAVSSPIAADIDHDGATEVVVNSPKYIYSLSASGVPEWGFLLPNQGSVQNCISSAALADINHDGKFEVFICAPYNNTLYCLEPDSGRELWNFSPNPVSRFMITTPTVVDLNLDRRYEILIGTADDAGGRLFCLNDSGRVLWNYPTPGSGIQGWQLTSACVGDVNGNDTLEIVATSNYWGIFCVNHRGQEKWARRYSEHSSSYPAMGDFDNDGSLEVVAGLGSYLRAFDANSGTPIWSFPVTAGYYIVSSPGLGDFDGNGKLEIVFGELKEGAPNDPDRFLYVLNDSGNIIWSDTVGTTFSDPTIGDIDHDRQLDLLIGPTYRSFNFWVFEADTENQVGRIEWPTLQHDIYRTGLYGYQDTMVTIAEESKPRLKQHFKIFPNPAQRSIYFQIIGSGNTQPIIIFDISGRMVTKINTDRAGYGMLNVKDFAPGVYFAVIDDIIGVQKKFIILK